MIPRRPHDVTPGWLTNALAGSRGAEAAPGSLRRVAAVSAERVGRDVGFTGPVARLRIDWEDGGGPRSLFAKFPDPDVSVLDPEHHLHELRFYEAVAPTVTTRVPRFHHGEADRDGRAVLVLEDVGEDVGDPFDACTVAQAEAALAELAPLHAAWWQRPGPAWLAPRRIDPDVLQARYGEQLDVFMERHGTRLPSTVERVLDGLRAGYAALVRSLLATPWTMTHADLNLDNLAFEPSGRAVILDWQLVAMLPACVDLAQLVAGGLSVADRRAAERRLLAEYHARLVAEGAEGVEEESVWDAYRLGLLYRLTALVRHWSRVEPDTIHQRWIDAFYERAHALTAVEDHHA